MKTTITIDDVEALAIISQHIEARTGKTVVSIDGGQIRAEYTAEIEPTGPVEEEMMDYNKFLQLLIVDLQTTADTIARSPSILRGVSSTKTMLANMLHMARAQRRATESAP